MKKVILAVVLVAAVQIANAQVQKGNWLLGGNLSFLSAKYSEGGESATAFTFAPNIGYFFADQIAGGIRGSISSAKDEDDDKYTDILIGPFARYYFLPAGKKTNLFLDGSYMFGSEKLEGFDSESKSQFAFMAGPAFFLSDNVALEVALAYNSMKYKDDDGRYNTFGINVGFQIHLNCAKKK